MGRVRFRTALFWLAIVLLVVFLGFWKTVGLLLGGFALLLALFFVALLVGFWLLRRRMNRKMAEFRQAFEKAQADAQARHEHAARKRDAIDVDAEVKD